MSTFYKPDLQVVFCPHLVFSQQQFRGTALFRHKHAVCSEEEFTSGKSLSNFTIVEESTDQWIHSFHLLPVTSVNAVNTHILLSLPPSKILSFDCTKWTSGTNSWDKGSPILLLLLVHWLLYELILLLTWDISAVKKKKRFLFIPLCATFVYHMR